MNRDTFENFKYSINTQAKYNGEWEPITEVWFVEGKIGLKNSGHLVDYSEVEEVK